MLLIKKFFDYSYKNVRLASVLLLCPLMFSMVTLAEENAKPMDAMSTDLYSIDNVVVDSDGKDSDEARSKALAQGQLDAFRQLVTKRNPAKAQDIIASISTSQINQMVSGFEVLEEKISPNHYHATLRYNFSPQNLRPLLTASDTPQPKVTDTGADVHKSKAVLVLPVLKEGDTQKLWQDDNKWRSIWYEAALESSKGLVVMPLGDLNDRVDVNDTNVDTATTKSLARLYGRYGVGEIYVLYAVYNKKADPKPTLEVTLKRLLPDKAETSHMDYIIRSTEDLDTLMARASNDIADHLYKLQTIDPNKIEYDRLKEINARVNAGDIHEWEDLRKRLLTHGNIVGIKLTSISFYETSMTITFRGTPDMLGKTLVASGLRVLQDGDNLVLMLK